MNKGTIHVGTYKDGSGPRYQISFNTESQILPRNMVIESSSDIWLSVNVDEIDELIVGMRKVAKAIRAVLPQPVEGERE